jgi:ribose transport system substrate-binding protein
VTRRPSVHRFIEERKHVRVSRINGRRVICAGLAAVAVAAAGCGSNDSDASNGSASSSSSSGGGSSDAIVAEAKKSVEAAKQGLPAKYSGPTEAVKNPGSLTLAVVPCGGAVRGCVALTEAAAALGKQLGWTIKQYDGKSDPSNQNKAMLQAAAAGADIILTGGVAADQIKSGIAAARKKGIVVGSMSQAEVPKPDGYEFDVNPPGPEMGKIAGDWMIADSDGKAVFQPWIDKEFGGAVQFLQGNIDRVKQCSTCKVLDPQQFVAASLTTNFGSRTVDVVRKNKDITYMNPSYDPAAAAQAAALMTAGLKNQVKITSVNGNKQNLGLVKNNQVQASDVAYDQVYVGWMAVYQALRLHDKMKLYETPGISDEVHKYSGNVPYKLFVSDNVPDPIEEWVANDIDWKGQLGKLMGLDNPQ